MRLITLVPLLILASGPGNPVLVEKPDAFKTLVNPRCSPCRDEAKRRAPELRGSPIDLCQTVSR